jgi:hypothetical protein
MNQADRDRLVALKKAKKKLITHWVFTLKQNQPDLLAEAARFTTGPPASIEVKTDEEVRLWHLPEVDWPVADRLVRIVKTVRIQHGQRIVVHKKTAVAGESTNV